MPGSIYLISCPKISDKEEAKPLTIKEENMSEEDTMTYAQKDWIKKITSTFEDEHSEESIKTIKELEKSFSELRSFGFKQMNQYIKYLAIHKIINILLSDKVLSGTVTGEDLNNINDFIVNFFNKDDIEMQRIYFNCTCDMDHLIRKRAEQRAEEAEDEW